MRKNPKIQWSLREDEVRHAEGGTQLVLILETLNIVNVDAEKITKLINAAAPEAIGLTALSADQRGFLLSNQSGVLKLIF